MKTSIWKATLCMVMILAVVACLPAFAQPGDGGAPGYGPPGPPPGGPGMGGPGGGQPGMMGPGMGMGRGMGMPGMGMGMPPTPPQPVVVVADGVVYVAFDGRIMAFEAKTLHKLSEANYAEPRGGMRRGPGPRDQGGDKPAPEPAHEGKGE